MWSSTYPWSLYFLWIVSKLKFYLEWILYYFKEDQLMRQFGTSSSSLSLAYLSNFNWLVATWYFNKQSDKLNFMHMFLIMWHNRNNVKCFYRKYFRNLSQSDMRKSISNFLFWNVRKVFYRILERPPLRYVDLDGWPLLQFIN